MESVVAGIGYAVFFAAGIVLVHTDIQEHRLPDRVVLPAVGALSLLIVAQAALLGQAASLLRALLSSAVLFALFLLLRIASPAGMGGGDVKLAALVGLFLGWHGWRVVVIGAMAAFVMGALWASAMMMSRRARADTAIAFGPCMILGSWAALFAV